MTGNSSTNPVFNNNALCARIETRAYFIRINFNILTIPLRDLLTKKQSYWRKWLLRILLAVRLSEMISESGVKFSPEPRIAKWSLLINIDAPSFFDFQFWTSRTYRVHLLKYPAARLSARSYWWVTTFIQRFDQRYQLRDGIKRYSYNAYSTELRYFALALVISIFSLNIIGCIRIKFTHGTNRRLFSFTPWRDEETLNIDTSNLQELGGIIMRRW